MNAWVDLRLGILREFYEQALLGGRELFRFEAAIAAWVEHRLQRKKRSRAKSGMSSYDREHFARLVARREARYRKIQAEQPRCLICGMPIQANYRGRLREKFCSKWCDRAANKLQASEREKAKRIAAKADRQCPVCGVSIAHLKASAKACGRRCYAQLTKEKQALYSQRYRERKARAA